MMALAGLLGGLWAYSPATPSGNMNGEYVVSSGAGKSAPKFNTDYASKGHEYFDVWSPEIATRYAEVWWHDMGKQPLPREIVARFANKTMAITGYEMDMVMVQPAGQPGANPAQDVSVPMNWAYNHHYEAWITGRYSELKKNEHPDPSDTSHHGGPQVRVRVRLGVGLGSGLGLGEVRVRVRRRGRGRDGVRVS